MPESSTYNVFLNSVIFRELGYRCSNLVEESIIHGAERDVVAAYLVPLVGVPDSTAPEVRDVVAALTFFALTKKNIFHTSTGVEKKQHEYGRDPDAEDAREEMCNLCAHKLFKFIKLKGIERLELRKCDDFCGIFYKSIFFW